MRVAVVGVGHLGKHHARILRSLPGVELIAVVDTNQARAEEIAAANQTRALMRSTSLLDKVDAVSIAVPTEQHLAVALPFLEAGVPVLVEKPMARSLEEADQMIAAAAKSGCGAGRRPDRTLQPGGRSCPSDADVIPDSSKCIASAPSRSAASTSTSCST